MKINFILIILACIGIIFIVKHENTPLNERFRVDKKPQEYMTEVFITSYTEEGNLKHKMSADYWAYLPEIEQSTFTKPHLIVYRKDGTIWHIEAKSGKALQPRIGVVEQIELFEAVNLERKADHNVVPIHLQTSILRYLPKKEYAESEADVLMIKPGLQISGTGMRAFLEQSVVELLQNVKTTYISQKS